MIAKTATWTIAAYVGLTLLAANPAYSAQSLPCESNRVYIENTWTPENLRRDIIFSNKRSFVYWRKKDDVENETGDRFVCEVLARYGNLIDNIVVIQIEKYYEHAKSLRAVPGVYNPVAGKISRSPAFSLYLGYGREKRIPSAPLLSDYENDLKEHFLPILEKELNR